MSASFGILSTPQGINETERKQPAFSSQWLLQSQEPEWDSFVLRHPSGSIYHTTEWKRAMEQAFPHIRGRFLVLREVESGQILAGLPVYRVNSWLLGSRIVSIPFATVCDSLVSTAEEWSVLAAELEKERARTNSKKVEIRAALNGGSLPPLFAGQSYFVHHELSLDTDFEDLCRRFDKQSVRQKAEKARRAGVTVEGQSDPLGVAVSCSLLAMTRRRLSLPPMPHRFFDAMQSRLRPEHFRIFLAYQNGLPVACHLILIFKDQWISEYSANADGAISGVNQLLYLETIRRACDAGARSFSFGRTSVNNSGLLSYKRRWGTIEENLTDFTLQRDSGSVSTAEEDGSPSEESAVYKLCKQVIARAPMPVCKMIGDFCYRHLG